MRAWETCKPLRLQLAQGCGGRQARRGGGAGGGGGRPPPSLPRPTLPSPPPAAPCAAPCTTRLQLLQLAVLRLHAVPQLRVPRLGAAEHALLAAEPAGEAGGGAQTMSGGGGDGEQVKEGRQGSAGLACWVSGPASRWAACPVPSPAKRAPSHRGPQLPCPARTTAPGAPPCPYLPRVWRNRKRRGPGSSTAAATTPAAMLSWR